MHPILQYLNSLPVPDQADFAQRCGTSLGYLRKASSIGQRFGENLCINFERESGRAVVCEMLRPDVDWAYLRGTQVPTAHAAIQCVANVPHIEPAAAGC